MLLKKTFFVRTVRIKNAYLQENSSQPKSHQVSLAEIAVVFALRAPLSLQSFAIL